VTREQLLLLPIWYAVFLLSLTVHEAAHALAALRGGDPTAYLGGQVSLSPLPHVRREPLGTVLAPLVSYLWIGGGWMLGWASAPYDPRWEQRHRARAAAMAAAGPLANLVLALAGFAILKVGLRAGWWVPGAVWPLDRIVAATEESAALEGLGRLCSVLMALNLVLFLFNLFPLPPMDGFSVVTGLVPRAGAWREGAFGVPLGGLLGLLVAWRVFPFVFGPCYEWVLVRLWSGSPPK
jgi:Zn-dependent protease